jgi:DNA-binding beta-propeller fold protein YncE
VLLYNGELCFAGNTKELYENPQNEIAAASLGPVNYFSETEVKEWLNNGTSRMVNLKPEQLIIEQSKSSNIVFNTVLFFGSFYKAELVNKVTGDKRFLFLRQFNKNIKKGEAVCIKLLLFFMICFLLMGCGAAKVDLKKKPTHIEVWSMPPAGIKIPGPRSLGLNHDGTEVVVVDNAGRVLIYNPTGKLLRQWKMPESSIGKPEGVCVLLNGNVVVSDTHYFRIVIFNSVGKVLKIFGKRGNKPGEFANPVAVTQDNKGFIYTCEYGDQNRVQKFTETGEFVKAFGASGMGDGEFQRPSGIVWKDGMLYIVDSVNHRIQVFSDEGEFKGILGDRKGHHLPFYLPYDIGIGNDNSLFVVEYGTSRVTKIDLKTETILFRSGRTGFKETELSTPWGLLVDSNNRVYIADTGNKRIVRWSWSEK